MAHDASNNNPAKESVLALAGIVLLLVIIGGIAVSGWLRPAGEHQPATDETAVAAAEQTDVAQPASEQPAQQAAQAEQPAEATADSQTAETQATEAQATEAKPADDKSAQNAEATAPADSNK